MPKAVWTKKNSRRRQRGTGSLFDRLEAELDEFTQSESTIARYLLANRNLIAFESATSLAEKLDVSAVTVGRFCRRVGYPNFRTLKDDLRIDTSSVPWFVGDQLEEHVAQGTDHERMQRSLKLEVSGLVEAYAMVDRPEWKAIVALLAFAPVVHVIGFQTERGLAMQMAHLLHYVRNDVHLVDGSAGNYADVLADDREGRILVLYETRRYSEHARKLCEAAESAGVQVVMIADKHCEWAERICSHVIALSTDSELFWNSMSAIVCVNMLLGNSVVAELGATVENRLARFSDLYQDFVGHVGRRR